MITSSCTRFRWSFRRDWGLYGEAEARSPKGLKAWMQPCYRWNPPFDLLQREELDRLGGHDVVVLNEVAVLGDAQLPALKAWVESGGVLVWTGRTGTRGQSGRRRTAGFAARTWGLDGMAGTEDGGEATECAVGKGRLVLAPGDSGLSPLEPPRNADRWQEQPVRVPASLRLRKPRGTEARQPDRARYLDPEGEDEVQVPVLDDGDAVRVQVRPALIRAYGLVEVALS